MKLGSAAGIRKHRKQALIPLSSNFSGAGYFWRAAMTPQLFCRAGQRVIFGDQLIMRRKPAADALLSSWLFGSYEAAPAKRNDVEAEMVATIARSVMRPQRLLAALCLRDRS